MGDYTKAKVSVSCSTNQLNQYTRRLSIKYATKTKIIDVYFENKRVDLGLSDGLNVIAFEDTMYTYGYRLCGTVQTFNTQLYDNDSQKFADYINSLDRSTIVLVLTRGDAKAKLHQNAIDAIKSLGSTMINQYVSQPDNNSFVIVSRANNRRPLAEATSNGQTRPYIVSFTHMSKVEFGGSDITKAQQNGIGDIIISAGSSNPRTAPAGTSNYCYTHIQLYPSEINPQQQAQSFVMSSISEVTSTPYFTTGYFLNSQAAITTMINDIGNIPIGNLVVICSSTLDSGFIMPDDLSLAFTTIGSQFSYNITSNSSFVVIGRKDAAPGSVAESLNNQGPVSVHSNFSKSPKIVKPFIEMKAVSQPSSPQSQFFINAVPIGVMPSLPGLNVIIVNPINGVPQRYYNFNTTQVGIGNPNPSADLMSMLDQQKPGTILAISSVGNASDFLTGEAKQKIVTRLGASAISSFNNNQSYCIIASVLDANAVDSKLVSECMSPSNVATTCNIRFPVKSLYKDISGYAFCVASFAKEETCHIMINGDKSSFNPSNGLNVAVIDPSLPFPGNVQRYNFNTFDYPSKWSTLLTLIQSLKNGVHVLIAVKKSMGSISSTTKFVMTTALSLIGASRFIGIPGNSSYVIAGMKGTPSGSAAESFSDGTSQVCISSWLPAPPPSTLTSHQVAAEYGQMMLLPFKTRSGILSQNKRYYLSHSLLVSDFGLLPTLEDQLLTVPLLNDYYIWNNPVAPLDKEQAVGNVYKTEPSYQYILMDGN
ncbi:hypothetical protein SAMD00019534_021950 [Acytostelium subglobosum LB1]|uniref:hypothetical protein n=1 Tax=Acytostelium subglobosum LB1 TaxID=1410327 RepID=UPI000644BC39|nr:hypothetical protein SAMD00019534_021950 [Acytostelium subglobosum LB1]GAM19020.1 hypothetical protein SAMD00019534_021950 [Acytostelium subglobosum LB1]|eukprot:XP_012756947.1 hypothetical protein SAMD00019534_021950 [Acytostelium subglobosum LB1]